MPLPAALALTAAAVAMWVAVLARRGSAWRLRPREADLQAPPPPAEWPDVRVVVPARNESRTLPLTLPALLAQDYRGRFEVILVDDRSVDGTAGVARDIARRVGGGERLTVIDGAPLPAGWAGKPWALQQGCESDGSKPAFLLFTDADIAHAPSSLATLVAESLADDLVLDSRMARLRCRSAAERLLIPAYLYFFNLLYPMARANDPGDRLAAAAGGCVLVRAENLRAAGGMAAIGERIIDDIALARLLKRDGARIRLALADGSVRSLRIYDEDPQGRDTGCWRGDIWQMVRRSAFTQLRHSRALLAAALLMLSVLFVLPPLLPALALTSWLYGAQGIVVITLVAGGATSGLAMAASYLPVLRYFGLPWWRVVTLPVAALLFGLMSVDSALPGSRAGVRDWR